MTLGGRKQSLPWALPHLIQNTLWYLEMRRITLLLISPRKSISARPKKINSEEGRTCWFPGHIQLSAFCIQLQGGMSAPNVSACAEQHPLARAWTWLRLILHSPSSCSRQVDFYEQPANLNWHNWGWKISIQSQLPRTLAANRIWGLFLTLAHLLPSCFKIFHWRKHKSIYFPMKKAKTLTLIETK